MIKLASGTLVDARYEVIEQIGEGGIGTVFRALEIGTERTVALKMLHLTLVADHDSQERFKREGAILSQLEHPNIMRCYRFGIWNERWPYISMEYLDGQSLNSVPDIDASRATTLGLQVCAAMDYAHRQNIIHRDLKPANIMVVNHEGAEVVKVVDFGLARALPKDGAASQHLTQTGTLIGSIYYMSPEQCLAKKADKRSDIYSLGCILYELLSGQPPFIADTPVGLMHLHTTANPLPLRGLEPGLNSVLMRAMAKNVDRRFQSMLELAEALNLVAQGRGSEIEEFVEGDSPTKKTLSRVLMSRALILLLSASFLVTGPVLFRWLQARLTDTSDIHFEGSVPRNLLDSGFGSLRDRALDFRPDEQSINRWLVKYGRRDPEVLRWPSITCI